MWPSQRRLGDDNEKITIDAVNKAKFEGISKGDAGSSD